MSAEGHDDKSTHPTFLSGSDEAGYGAWAGPLCVAAVRVPVDWVPPLGLKDSKKLSEAQRETLYVALSNDPQVTHRIRMIPANVIDRQGIYNCLRQAHESLHQEMTWGIENVRCIADGNLQLQGGIESIPRADATIPAVSAAAIFAKVTRDREMVRLDEQFPGYGLRIHKGYGVPHHAEMLRKLGPCFIHRMSYTPVAQTKFREGSILDMLSELDQE
jgi:ribonuclease HII